MNALLSRAVGYFFAQILLSIIKSILFIFFFFFFLKTSYLSHLIHVLKPPTNLMSFNSSAVPTIMTRELEYQLSTSPAQRVASRVASYALHPNLFVYPKGKYADDLICPYDHQSDEVDSVYIGESLTHTPSDGAAMAIAVLETLPSTSSSEKPFVSVLFPTHSPLSATIKLSTIVPNKSSEVSMLKTTQPCLSEVLAANPEGFSDKTGLVSTSTFPLSLPVLFAASLQLSSNSVSPANMLWNWILVHADLSALDFSIRNTNNQTLAAFLHENLAQSEENKQSEACSSLLGLKTLIFSIVHSQTGEYAGTDWRSSGVVSKSMLDIIHSFP